LEAGNRYKGDNLRIPDCSVFLLIRVHSRAFAAKSLFERSEAERAKKPDKRYIYFPPFAKTAKDKT
jgi:hypothetical protein